MRPTRLTRTSTCAALRLALAAAVAVAPAYAADDDVPLDTKIIRGLLEGLGLKRDGAPVIQYEERAPLVIPPDKSLPPPENAKAAIANNPAWPKDPDIARAKLSVERNKDRDTTAEMERASHSLSPSELTPGRAAGGSAPPIQSPSNAEETTYGFKQLTPSELGFKGTLFGTMFGNKEDSEAVRFTGEPPRTALTAPPPGYQVPSPAQPYGVGKESVTPQAENSYVTHGEIQQQ
jgi:hypothetical protein